MRCLHAGKGWRYSPEAVTLLRSYIAAFPWAPRLLSENGDTATPDLANAFPEYDSDELAAAAAGVQKWRQGTVLAGRKLVSTGAQSLPGSVIQQLNDTLGAQTLRRPAPETLDCVAPHLLLPPISEQDVTAAVAASSVQCGDIAVVVSGLGDKLPPFGALCVVVAVHADFAEVLCAQPFPGGTTLEGRINARKGALVPFSALLNAGDPPKQLLFSMKGSGTARRGAAAASPVRGSGPPRLAGTGAADALPVNVRGPEGRTGFSAGLGRGRGVAPLAAAAASAAPVGIMPATAPAPKPLPPAQALAAMYAEAGSDRNAAQAAEPPAADSQRSVAVAAPDASAAQSAAAQALAQLQQQQQQRGEAQANIAPTDGTASAGAQSDGSSSGTSAHAALQALVATLQSCAGGAIDTGSAQKTAQVKVLCF